MCTSGNKLKSIHKTASSQRMSNHGKSTLKWRDLVALIFLCLSCQPICSQENGHDVVEAGRQFIHTVYHNLSSPITSAESPSSPLDLIFVLDRSASVTTSGWQAVLRFVHNFLEHFTVDADNTRVAVVSYGTTASVDIDGLESGEFNKCLLVTRLQKQLAVKVPSGYSATHAALLRVVDVVLKSRAKAKKVVVVITDGRSNIGPPPVRASVGQLT